MIYFFPLQVQVPHGFGHQPCKIVCIREKLAWIVFQAFQSEILHRYDLGSLSFMLLSTKNFLKIVL